MQIEDGLRNELNTLLDSVSEIVVLAETDDPALPGELADLFGRFDSVAGNVSEPALKTCSSALLEFLEGLPEKGGFNEKALDVCVRTIQAFQRLVRDNRDFSEAGFPSELGVAPTAEPEKEPAFVDEEEAAVEKKADNLKKRSDSEMAGVQTDVAQSTASNAGDLAGKYLTFKLGDEEYGLEILKVQEIIKMMEVTKVPRTPEFVRGVINLRGKVIPVVDLRIKFGMPSMDNTDMTCVIVVQVSRGDESITMGLIVDEVSEVMDITMEQIEPPPEFGAAVDTAFILGMGKVEKKVVMLLDVDKVLSKGDLNMVGSM